MHYAVCYREPFINTPKSPDHLHERGFFGLQRSFVAREERTRDAGGVSASVVAGNRAVPRIVRGRIGQRSTVVSARFFKRLLNGAIPGESYSNDRQGRLIPSGMSG